MAKRLSRQEKIDKALSDIINKMFEIAGHDVTYSDIKNSGNNNWFQQYSMTERENAEWVLWGKKYLQKKLYMYSKMAKKEMLWINLMYGLKVIPYSRILLIEKI